MCVTISIIQGDGVVFGDAKKDFNRSENMAVGTFFDGNDCKVSAVEPYDG